MLVPAIYQGSFLPLRKNARALTGALRNNKTDRYAHEEIKCDE